MCLRLLVINGFPLSHIVDEVNRTHDLPHSRRAHYPLHHRYGSTERYKHCYQVSIKKMGYCCIKLCKRGPKFCNFLLFFKVYTIVIKKKLMLFFFELIATRASDSILMDLAISVMIFQFNLTEVKLVKGEVLVDLLLVLSWCSLCCTWLKVPIWTRFILSSCKSNYNAITIMTARNLSGDLSAHI